MTEIDGHTKLFGLLANPAHHSLSPKIMNESFAETDTNARYLAFELAEEDLATAIAGLKASGISGFNLSMPFKQAVLPLLDEVTERAQLLQSVNVVKQENGRLNGDTVDGEGFIANLKHHVSLAGKKVVQLGAGGAGRSVLEALSHEPLANITVIKRKNGTFVEVADLISKLQVNAIPQLQLRDYQTEVLLEEVPEADIIINSTNIGMKSNQSPLPSEVTDTLTDQQVVADMIYEPRQTELLKLAQQHGCQIIPGVGMLIEQAAASFKWWTDKAMPIEHINQLIKDGTQI